MAEQKKDPAALAGAHRVRVITLSGRNDFAESSLTAFDLQVRKVLGLSTVSPSLAAVIAVLAFSSGRAS